MRGLIFLFISLLSCSRVFSQEVNIHELIQRTDLTLEQIDVIAQAHFTKVGKGRGTGYKQYERWRYEQKFHLHEDGTFTTPEEEANAYEFAKRAMPEKSGFDRAAPGPWTELGPKSWTSTSGWNPGVGRLTSVAIHPSNENIIYVSSPGGGIWKSTNAAATWTPLIDNVNSSWMNVYNLCIDPSNVNTIYAGLSSGAVLKSSDAGATWASTGSGPSTIRKIVVHPSNSNIVFAGASNGLYRSTNGGTSWTTVQSGSFQDIEFKPNDPNTMYASTSSSSTYRSIDNGLTWSLVTLTGSGRTLIGVSPNSPDVVYMVQASGSIFGAFYRSTDAGQTYTTMITGSSGVNNFFGYETDGTGTSGQATYDMAICVNPTNVNEVHIAGIICWKTTNGGTSFVAETAWSYPNSIGYNHADVHGLEWINNTIYSVSDGGVYKSTDFGDNWTDLSSGLGIRQFYRIATAKTDANLISGGAQDNGTTYRQTNGTWKEWLGADGMDCVISPTNASICIGTSQNGSIYKTTNAGNSYSGLSRPANGNWVTPLFMHPTNHDTVYGGWNGIYRSVNGGSSWTNLTSSISTGNFDCLAVASSNTRYIYGSVGSTLYRSSDAGATWTSVTPGGTITSICVSPLNPQKLWVTTSATSNNIKVSTDFGSTWVNISAGLPAVSARSIVVDNSVYEGLYVGMNIGVYYRDNINTAWTVHAPGLPLVAINEVELQLSSKKIRVATYGRGVWETTMQDPPKVDAGLDVTVTCANPSTTLTAVNGVSYVWSNGENTASITVSPTITTTYTVTATMASGSTSTDNVTVFTNKIPPTANAGADVTVTCTNPSTTLTASGGGTYLWNNNVSSASNPVAPGVTTTYTVTVTSTNGCTASDQVTVTADKILPIANAGPDIAILAGTSTTLNATGGISYLWSNGSSNTSITVTPSATTTYTVTVTGSSGCTAIDDVIVTVQSSSGACAALSFGDPIIQNNKFRCVVQINSCNFNFSLGASNFRFNYNKLALSNPKLLSEAFPSPDFGTTTTTGSNTTNGIVSLNTAYNGAANANIILLTSSVTKLLWIEFDIINSSLTSGLSWRISGAQPRTTLVDDDKLTSITTIIGVGLDVPLEGITTSPDITLNCVNPNTTLNVTGLSNYIWNTGETTNSINVSPTITTTYSVSATNSGVTAIDEVIITTDKTPPTVVASPDITQNCGAGAANITVNGALTYLWNTGETTTSITVAPTITSTYSVTGTATNGCTASDNTLVTVLACNSILLSPRVYLNHIDNINPTHSDYLKSLSNFPLTDPYSSSVFNTNFIHVNNPNVATTTPLVLNTSGNNSIVDWIFLELRQGTSGLTNVTHTKSALLQKDGDIVATDGISPVDFAAPPANYYVAVRHRTHLGFRTLNPISLSSISTNLDFTNGSVPVYGASPLVQLQSNLYAMPSGDANSDGSIDAFDTILWEAQNGLFDDYLNNSDYNMDGSVDAFDSILWELNNGKFQELD